MGAAVAGRSPVYTEDFSQGSGGWHFYQLSDTVPPSADYCGTGTYGYAYTCQMPMDWSDSGTVESKAPWFVDENHAAPGAGILSLIGWVWLNGEYGGIPAATLDLRNTELTARIWVDDLVIGDGHLVFWFQTYRSEIGKYQNYALTAYPVERHLRDEKWVTVRIHLPKREGAWTCLGAAPWRVETYGCGSVADALADVNYDFGFIVLPVSPSAPPTGVVRLDSISIDRP